MPELSRFPQVSSAGSFGCDNLPLAHGGEETGRMDQTRPTNRWQNKQRLAAGLRRDRMSIGTIILIILVIALLGGFSGIGGGPFYGTGYYGGGGLGLIIVILLILLLLGRI
jgi:hypothetical protein